MTRLKRLGFYVASLFLGIIVATQWAASQFPGRNLGSHLTIRGLAIYPPWSLISWLRKWHYESPRIYPTVVAIVAAHCIVATVILLFVSVQSPSVRPMGTDRWANLRDIKRAGLATSRGTVIGRYRGRLLTYDGPEHQLVVGASRSGKGVGHVIPTLLTWPASTVIYDIKAELWQATAGYRSRFSHCLFFDPTRLDSARYNPLLEVRKGLNEIRDVQNIVEMLVNPDGSKEQLDVWDQHAAQLLVALCLHVLYSEPDHRKHFGVVRERLLDLPNTFKDMIELPHRLNTQSGVAEPHPEVARVAKELMRQAPKFAAGVRATAAGHLALYADEIVCRNVAVSDFAVGDLVCSDHPVTLYLQPPPSDVPRLRPLMRIMVNQICRALLERLDTDSRGRQKRFRLLLELDEFATLGRLEFLTTNLRQMAGYGIKAHIIVQSFNDIIEKYGPHQTILDNCHVTSVFACADTVTQQRVSQMTGVAVEYRDSFGHRRSIPLFPDSLQKAEQLRPLLQPGDVRALPPSEQLVFVTGYPPLRTKKIRYYVDGAFKHRVVAPPEQTAGVDSPRKQDFHPILGIPNDWIGERAKGVRAQTEEIFDPIDDEEWMLPGTVEPLPGAPANARGREDPYGL